MNLYPDAASVVDVSEPIDARVDGRHFKLCTFNGEHKSSDGKQHCKYYVKASRHNRCMFYREDISETERTYKSDKRELYVCDSSKDRRAM